MSDKPKTFEEFRKKEIDERMKRDAVLITGAEAAWNARDELAKEEIEAVRAEMQAEIDKRDAIIENFNDFINEHEHLEAWQEWNSHE